MIRHVNIAFFLPPSMYVTTPVLLAFYSFHVVFRGLSPGHISQFVHKTQSQLVSEMHVLFIRQIVKTFKQLFHPLGMQTFLISSSIVEPAP